MLTDSINGLNKYIVVYGHMPSYTIYNYELYAPSQIMADRIADHMFGKEYVVTAVVNTNELH